jgi:anti-sigma factor RsiW
VSGHVHLELADYLAGRLSDERRRQFEKHVRSCESCAAEARWAAEFREEALRQGLRHLDPQREIAIASDPTAASHAERSHLDRCQACRTELEWMRAHPDDEADDEEEEPSTPRRAGRPWAWAAAAAAIVVLGLLWVRQPWNGADIAQLARIEPLPVRISRSAPEAGSFQQWRLSGLDAYAAGDYASARDALGRAAQLRPDDAETRLYFGSSALLDGDLETAAAELRLAAALAEDAPALRDEAMWQAANVALAGGRPEEAERLLRDLSAELGPRADDARRLLAVLRSRP